MNLLQRHGQKKNFKMIALLMFTYNEQDHIKQTLDSVLNQDYPDFKLIILDDCSTDKTYKILQDYQNKDNRISLYSNKIRKGYCYNYRKTFELIIEEPKYFAWVAGHDVYAINWLSSHIKDIEKNNDIALIYSKSSRIDKNNNILPHHSGSYSNHFINSEYKRVHNIIWNGAGYGNMIYGLMRYSIVKKMNKFPLTLVPDMVFIFEISKWGTIYLIQQTLWQRRFLNKYDPERQRQIAFNKIPRYLYINWRIINFFILLYRTVIRIPSKQKKRILGLYISFNYFLKYFIDYIKMYLFKLKY
tara:strand:- start:1440 stop:2342 length:903 start_codon:yes stop_codon:yes gene_type:complete